MKYQLFLFDLDDTLLDFRASEKLSFYRAMESLSIRENLDAMFGEYQVINSGLWKLFEEGKTHKDHLKVERFRQTFKRRRIDVDPELASARYLDALPETVVLMEHARELCEYLAGHGEIGIITNGIQSVQSKRIQNSALAPFVSFVSVSDECGHAKPDVRFFDYTVKKAKAFSKASTIIVGDREDADIQGAHNFGIDSCWFNPQGKASPAHLTPTHVVRRLSELRELLT